MSTMWKRVKSALRTYWSLVTATEPNRDNCSAEEYADWQDRKSW